MRRPLQEKVLQPEKLVVILHPPENSSEKSHDENNLN
jgi:hypothetical protein